MIVRETIIIPQIAVLFMSDGLNGDGSFLYRLWRRCNGKSKWNHIVILATSDLHGNILGYSYEDTADFCDNEVKGLLVDRLADEIKEYLYAYEDYEEAKDDNRDATFNLNCEREELLKELEEFGSPLAIITPSINSINRLLSLSGFSGFKVIEHEDLYYNAPYAAVSLFSKYTIKKKIRESLLSRITDHLWNYSGHLYTTMPRITTCTISINGKNALKYQRLVL